MNFIDKHIYQKSGLLSRNEGKLKTVESCSDIRAWSHDLRARDRYLREWMKCDMPICVIPVYTLASFLRTMTCRSRAKATPRCHPDCKSKVLLESICTSCDAIKKCLKDNPSFDKYFAEEEFETSHWPCDKCLEVLKSIKMFWKIIKEKIFGINIPKAASLTNIYDSRTDNVKSVAKVWEKELVKEALFIQTLKTVLSKENVNNENAWPQGSKKGTTCIPRPCKISKDSLSTKTKKVRSPTYSVLSQRTNSIGTSCISSRNIENKLSRKFHKQTMVDEACETCNIEQERKNLEFLKNNVEALRNKCDLQDSEIENLKRENNSLKIELQKFYKTSSWKSIKCIKTSDYDKTVVVPKPFESIIEDTEPAKAVKDTDSEMIITMKNCRNERYKHVSLLKVLHKTNEIINNFEASPCSPLDTRCKKENPIDLLNRVQCTVGKIVEREIMLVNKRYNSSFVDINASFHKLPDNRSVPSCSTVYLQSPTSESSFEISG